MISFVFGLIIGFVVRFVIDVYPELINWAKKRLNEN